MNEGSILQHSLQNLCVSSTGIHLKVMRTSLLAGSTGPGSGSGSSKTPESMKVCVWMIFFRRRPVTVSVSIQSMGQVYLPTRMVVFFGKKEVKNGKYTSPMDTMG